MTENYIFRTLKVFFHCTMTACAFETTIQRGDCEMMRQTEFSIRLLRYFVQSSRCDDCLSEMKSCCSLFSFWICVRFADQLKPWKFNYDLSVLWEWAQKIDRWIMDLMTSSWLRYLIVKKERKKESASSKRLNVGQKKPKKRLTNFGWWISICQHKLRSPFIFWCMLQQLLLIGFT